MNLTVKDLLYGPKKKGKQRNGDIDEEEPVDNEEGNIGEDESEIKNRTEAEKKRWRALGAVGKAHNIVKWIPDSDWGDIETIMTLLKSFKNAGYFGRRAWNITWVSELDSVGI